MQTSPVNNAYKRTEMDSSTRDSFDMPETAHQNIPWNISRDGFEIFSLLTEDEYFTIKKFALTTLGKLFYQYAGTLIDEQTLLSYHIWGKKAGIPHQEMLKAKNRHLIADKLIENLLLNIRFEAFLDQINIKRYKIWDEGLGWLAFRLIRPGPGDGYPFSCKNWGPAKNVLSLWIPVLGFSQNVMINLIPGSHKKEYPKYLPEETHFTKDEYRLNYIPSPQECIRPIMKPGQCLIFHPNTLHAEEVANGDETRLNLEFRIVPL